MPTTYFMTGWVHRHVGPRSLVSYVVLLLPCIFISADAQCSTRGPGYGCTTSGSRCCFSAQNGCPRCPNEYRVPSALYGCEGELWRANGRIPDFSYAGYHQGSSLPSLSGGNIFDVTQFGATADGSGDSTAAIRDAISRASAAGGGVVFFPSGRFHITNRLDINSKGVVLRGSGQGRTTLYFPQSLTQVAGRTSDRQYSYGPGFINFLGNIRISDQNIIQVTQRSSRGDRRLWVDTTGGLSSGMWVALMMSEEGGGSLVRDELNAGLISGGSNQQSLRDRVFHLSPVTSIGEEGGRRYVDLERPLILNVDTKWSPRLRRYECVNGEMGIESLTLEFPRTSYPGHFREEGYNGIFFVRTCDCWAQHVTVVNADTAIILRGNFNTLHSITVRSEHREGPYSGHHGVVLFGAIDNVVSSSKVLGNYWHNLGISEYSYGNVITNIEGSALNLDHHRTSPFANLFTNINIGVPNRTWVSGGDAINGPHTSKYSTFWNVRTTSGQAGLPENYFGPLANFIGVAGAQSAPSNGMDWYVEAPCRIHPWNLYDHMKATRTSRLQQGTTKGEVAG